MSHKTQSLCKSDMSFEECELTILRSAVDKAQKKMGKRVVSSPEVREMIHIVEDFIRKKQLICYGGTAINNILPEEDQFYDREVELPDYDFYSPNSLQDAKDLADAFFLNGYNEVEAKSGVHHGTYKVFCNGIALADVTYLPHELFRIIFKDSIKVNDILYCPPNFLRMSMYLELSRPAGDVSRWEKIAKRLALLNKHYPLKTAKCDSIQFQRDLSDEVVSESNGDKRKFNNMIYSIVKDEIISAGGVFFGGYAISMYSKYMPHKEREFIRQVPDFDALVHDPERVSNHIKHKLSDKGIKFARVYKRSAIGEVIPEQYEIRVGQDTVAVLYKPIACHSFNKIRIHDKEVRIATIDTMLSFYLAFIYANKPYYDPNRILCMTMFLFDIQQKNRLQQKGLLRRFTVTCFGKQESIEDIRSKKIQKYNELRRHPNKKDFDAWFLNYRPAYMQLKLKSRDAINRKITIRKRGKESHRKTQRFL
jgi:hypothetical protein